MKNLNSTSINNFLFDFSNGFLIRFRAGKGIEPSQLNIFLEILEQLRMKWKGESLIEKELIFELISVVPALYQSLPVYAGKEEFEEYKNTIYNLDTALSMCLNPDENDPNFNIPLKNLEIF